MAYIGLYQYRQNPCKNQKSLGHSPKYAKKPENENVCSKRPETETKQQSNQNRYMTKLDFQSTVFSSCGLSLALLVI